MSFRRSYGTAPTPPVPPEVAVRVSGAPLLAIDDPTRSAVMDALAIAKPSETGTQRLARLITRVTPDALTGYTTVQQTVDVDLAAVLAPAITAGCVAFTTNERATFSAVCGYRGLTVETV